MSNCVEKIRKVGAEACANVENAYYSAAQMWWQQISTFASQEEASCTSIEQSCALAFITAERYLFDMTENDGTPTLWVSDSLCRLFQDSLRTALPLHRH